jgi:hypothetical protein
VEAASDEAAHQHQEHAGRRWNFPAISSAPIARQFWLGGNVDSCACKQRCMMPTIVPAPARTFSAGMAHWKPSQHCQLAFVEIMVSMVEAEVDGSADASLPAIGPMMRRR